MLIQPRPYLDNLRLRNHAQGKERRRNMSKIILERGTPFPKPIEYSDIDEAMYNWVNDVIDIAYDGKRLPTYKLYSTQRISEYVQEWDKMDETGNPIINFKTVTRENNPQKGDNQGTYFNIPGHKDVAMFYVPVLQENGTEAFDKYTMKQPFQVNFIYSVSIISNKMEIINKMNELMLYEFNAINCYIEPNGHPMSMTLEDISDNSEYAIDDRKYYAQTYKVKVRGYIIRKEDFKVERIVSRVVVPFRDSDASGRVHKRGKNREDKDKVKFMEYDPRQMQHYAFESMIKDDDSCEMPFKANTEKQSDVFYEEQDVNKCCYDDESKYTHKVMKIFMDFDCTLELTFNIDKEMVLESVETTNVYDFKILVNGEVMKLDGDVKFYEGDEITVRITREDLHKPSEVVLVGFDPNKVYNWSALAEVSVDEAITEEHIIVNTTDEDREKEKEKHMPPKCEN